MKNYSSVRLASQAMHKTFLLVIAAALLLTCALPAVAQKDKKKKKDNMPPADASNTLVPLSDEQQIDYTISEVLGAWQVGDIEKLHKDYADDVAIVSALWGPPVIGWTNYLAIYQQQKAHMQQVRLDRTNTFIRVRGTVGWACYQWDFGAVVDGQQVASQGQTTVVLEKRNNHWVIVHNHTSFVQGVPSVVPTNTPPSPQQPANPGMH
jgi:ketosteroid isomerase-like protein